MVDIKKIGTNWNRKNLDDINENFKELYGGLDTQNQKIENATNDLSKGNNGIVYDNPLQKTEIESAMLINSLKASKENYQSIDNKVVCDFQLGLVSEQTGIPAKSPKSVKFHSDKISFSEKEVMKIKISDFLNGIVFYYKNNEYVSKSRYFTNSLNVIGDSSFDEIVVMFGYRDNRTISDYENFKNAILAVDIIKMFNFSLSQKTKQFELTSKLTPLKYNFGNSIDIPSKYEEIVDLKGNKTGLFNTVIKDCNEGDIFLISGTGGVSPRLWSFLDTNDNLIAVSKSELTLKSKYIIAPARAKKLVINDNSSSISYKVDKKEIQEEIILDQENIPVGSINIAKSQIGETANINMSYTVNFSSTTLPVETNDVLRLEGSGGSNPRFYAYLDKNFKLLKLSDVFYASRHENHILVIPEKVRYVVFNSNLQAPYKPKISLLPANSELARKISKERSVSQREIPITMKMTELTNGIEFKEKIETPLFNFKMESEGDIMAHCSSFRIVDDVVYSSFYVNKIRHFEDPREQTAVLRIRNLDGTGETKNATVADIGDVIPEGKIDAIYDTVVLTELNDIRVIFTARVNGQYYLLYKIYNKENNTFSEVKHCQFTVNNTTEEFSINGMKRALKANDVYYPYFDSDVSFMQKLTPRIENGEKWWYLGLGVLQFCFIAKTKDLVNYHYVSQPTFEHNNMYEPSVYAKGDEVFWLCRQAILANYPYAHLSKYNLVTGEWSNPVKLLDCQSRSDFFEFNNILYAIHAPFDRNHLTVTRINGENLSMSFAIQTAYVNNMFYPFVQNYKNKLYMTVTQGRNYIQFNDFVINSFGVSNTIKCMKTNMESLT